MIYTTLINPGELQRLIVNQKNSGKNDLLLLDCSCSIAEPTIGRKLYQEGHIPGAIFVDFDEIVTGTVHKGTGRHPLPSRDTFLKNLKDLGWSPEKQVVIYDQGRLGFATRFGMKCAGGYRKSSPVSMADLRLGPANQDPFPRNQPFLQKAKFQTRNLWNNLWKCLSFRKI